MKQITLSNLKGGVGKSTLAINLAHAFGVHLDVAVWDSDTQKTSKSLASEYVKIYNAHEKIGEHQMLIVDTPPYLDVNFSKIYLESDLIIVPTKPSYADYDALIETIALIEKTKVKRPDLKVVIVITMEDAKSVLSDTFVPALEKLGFPILKTKIGNRANFTRSIVSKEGIYSFRDKLAINEFNEFVKEIYSYLI